jgi:hypothetical protein
MTKFKTISQARPELITWLVAETCLERKGIEPKRELVEGLTAKANFHFVHNEQFKKGVMSKANQGNAGRDYLIAFINHWIDAKYWNLQGGVLPKTYLPYKEEIP